MANYVCTYVKQNYRCLISKQSLNGFNFQAGFQFYSGKFMRTSDADCRYWPIRFCLLVLEHCFMWALYVLNLTLISTKLSCPPFTYLLCHSSCLVFILDAQDLSIILSFNESITSAKTLTTLTK